MDVDELVEEVQEARRIKLLHHPSKVMAMEHEFHALRDQIREKSMFSIKLQKEGMVTFFTGHGLTAYKKTHQELPFDMFLALTVSFLSANKEQEDEENKSRSYMLDGSETLGSCLQVQPCSDEVTISQMNGQDHSSHSVHAFHVERMRIKLCRGWITKAREIYSPSMQLCGVRSDMSNAAKALFWQARKGCACWA
ncbi:stomatal closure-related actin-binding protein 3 isoform X2 [Senna tora]|uniref:Stomatal closure-related actin-binding protein 3 isoform X2 n=1 Tax=Senna tora TaxID=362788 RepID=A0A834TK26_9FABA|nr:stomatal closure-related actin-binding protein 3 isoform X2 [Senna tora]